MKGIKKILITIFILILFGNNNISSQPVYFVKTTPGSATSFSAVMNPYNRISVLHWNNPNIPWYMHSAGAGDVSVSATEAALKAAFQTWQDVNTSYQKFTYKNLVSTKHNNSDGKNVMFWAENGDQGFTSGYYGTVMDPATYALTIITVGSGQEITDVDIAFNGRDFSWDDEPFTDIQSYATHEIGHLLGIGHYHGGLPPWPTMKSGGAAGEPGMRSLQPGDVEPITFLYKKDISVPGDFSTINHAIITVVHGSGQTIEVSGSQTLIDDVEIPSGVTLVIKSGATVNLNNYYIKSTGGTITIESGAEGKFAILKTGSTVKGLYSSIQSAINLAVSGQTVELTDDTYTENIYMKANVDLIGDAGSYALNGSIINGTITLNNDDNVRIENLKVKNKILVTNSDNVYLNIRSDHPNCYVEAVNSDIYFYDPYFFQTQAKAFYGHDNGHSDFFKGSFRNKTSQGAYLHYWATADFTESIFCTNVFDINATGMTYAAINNYGYFSNPQYRSTVTSAVSVTPSQWFYCSGSALAKSTEEPTVIIEVDDLKEISSANTEFETAMNDYRIIKSKIREDLKTESVLNPSKHRSDYEKTIDAFKEVVEKYPTSTEAILALDKISSSFRALGEYENLLNYNNSISNNKNYNVLRPHALNIEKQTLIKQGAFTKALELSDQIIKEYPNHELVVELIYSKGLIYNYYLNDKEKAAEMFQEVIAKYPKEMTAQSAREELENLGIEFEVNKQILTEGTNIFNVESYPNPFNPSTTISYSLPSDAKVKVVIYDIMGRVIKTLTSDTQTSGTHQVIWDGTNHNGVRVSSGIYLYRFEAASLTDSKHFTKTAKLMLVK